MVNTIDNSADVLDSRDVIARIEELESEIENIDDMPEGDMLKNTVEGAELREELRILKVLAGGADGSPDWIHGETLIRETYFTDYIKEMIADCYPMPKELNSGDWPWRHITVDYEAAAEEAKADYMEADFDGVAYLIRA